MKTATPRALEERLEKYISPAHSSFILFSVVGSNRVSHVTIMSALYLSRKFKIFRRLGCFPMLLQLKLIILKFDAEGALPQILSATAKSC